MSRDALLVALVALVCGTLAWCLAPLCARLANGPAWRCERRAWRGVIAPLIVVALGTALLAGWALDEPARSDERLAQPAWLLVGAVALVWLRAAVRFARAALARPSAPLSVVGLLRPRIVIDPAFEASLDSAALAAALAHEAAHVRHRDPLRIALGQLATDLQWPWPAARHRFETWRGLLEDCRDDEAIVDGSCREDLAHAIVAAARFETPGAGAALTGGLALVSRVARLLDGAECCPPSPSRWFGILFTVGLFAALFVGMAVGDDLIGLLPGVVR